MSAAFSTDSSAQIEAVAETEDKKTLNSDQLQHAFDINRTVEWITQHNFHRVALQFPDDLLFYSAKIVEVLEQRTNQQIFILADTSYGSCCVDEVACQHYSADCLVHYGMSCLSPPSRLPCLFVFPKEDIDSHACSSALRDLLPDSSTKILLMYDPSYQNASDDLHQVLLHDYPHIVMPRLNIPTGPSDSSSEPESEEAPPAGFQRSCHCGRIITLPAEATLEDYIIVYIGAESQELTNLMMNFNKNAFYSYNPATNTARKETANVNKLLMKRYYMVQRAKDANIVGIVAGTLGVAKYLDEITRLKLLFKKVGKKCYTFVVGKLNVPKLANFMEVDVFVLVACPLNTLLDSKEFVQPVVTPYEMEVACSREWTGQYVTDFRELLPGGLYHEAFPEDLSEATYDVSLLSGGIRSMGQREEESAGDQQIVATRPEAMSITTVNAKSAEEYLHQRSWQGLEQQLGETPVTKAVQGQKGIAMAYENETKME